MNKTLEMLKPLITEENLTLEYSELIKEYKKELNPMYLAAAFEKIYKLAIALSKRYIVVEQDDVVSYTLTTLDFCLQNFEEKYNSKFTTYFSTILLNEFRNLAAAANTQKRKANLFNCSYEQMVEDGFDIAFEHDYQINELEKKLDNCELNNREKLYCYYLTKDYTNAEISNLMDLSIMTLSNMRKKLRLKLALDF